MQVTRCAHVIREAPGTVKVGAYVYRFEVPYAALDGQRDKVEW